MLEDRTSSMGSGTFVVECFLASLNLELPCPCTPAPAETSHSQATAAALQLLGSRPASGLALSPGQGRSPGAGPPKTPKPLLKYIK